MNIGPLREKIDALDRKLVDLINERLALAAEIGLLRRTIAALRQLADPAGDLL